MTIDASNNSIYTILFVDDEQNILRAIKRALFKFNANLLFAESGAQALEILKGNKVDVVFSDMKMPQMNGAELLEQVAQLYPHTFRVVLTGYADIDSTIKAVNRGKIHRYLQKPWDNQELMNTIEEGLERIRLRNENERLQKLTQQQNEKLKDINNTLEQTVLKRTKQVRASLVRIEKDKDALERVLFNVISINPDISGRFGLQVSELAKQLCQVGAIPEEQEKSICYAAQICELGLLGLLPEDFRQPFNKLKYEQQKQYYAQAKQASLILAPAFHLQDVSDMIQYQFEHYNGQGPYQLVANEIPVGARIIAVARDYWRYRGGRITGHEVSSLDAKQEMKKFRNTRYDGTFIDILLRLSDVDHNTPADEGLSAGMLKPGMVLQDNLYNEGHILLLPEGHVLTEKTIAKLRHYEHERGQRLKVSIAQTPTSEG